jgi:ABC-type polysaccharide/polyol phosphate transport system ATPase subunit
MLTPMPQPSAAIEVAGVHKTFRIPEHRVSTLKERALHPLRRTRYHELRVLQDISFRILQGEFFGILGRNGSGKSTLLKCLAGIYRLDAGRIWVTGRLAPFIELGVGFNPDLTATENVEINAVMMGLTPAEARSRFDDVIRFAELEEFVDLKLKNYSSGMQVRLAFATMVQSDADVMLIDEVLAVGDAAFQEKCFAVFDRLRAEGKTIVLVTHDMRLVDRFCDRAMVINEGRIDSMGDPERIAQRYLDINYARSLEEQEVGAVADRAEIPEVWVTDATSQPSDSLPYGERVQLWANIVASTRLDDVEIRIWVENELGTRVFAASTLEFGRPLDPMRPGERRRLRVAFPNRLVSDTYHVGVLVRSRNAPGDVFAVRHRAARFGVIGGEHVGGLYEIDHDLDLDPIEERARA